jgi:eukaryotic-like serine/threonine-protein kinase
MVLAPGAVVGHFRIEARLGAGGMGVVYLAEDIRLKRKVALKFLAGSGVTTDAVRRLEREAQAAGALDHPNIAAVHEIGEWESQPFIALAYCPGETLKQRLARGPLPIEEILSILGQIAEGLASAHAAGVVHRDLKPANIIVAPDGHVRVVDFGIAQMAGPEHETATRVTGTGVTLGTVAYMAPEQLRGDVVDAGADVWALGAITYEMLAGHLPFEGEHVFAVMQAVLEGTPAPVDRLRPDTPPELVHLVASALQPDRRARSITAADVAALVAGLRTAHIDVLGASPVRVSGWHLHRLALVALVTVVLFTMGLGLWLWAQRRTHVRWARNTAIPEISRLAGLEQYTAAVNLAREAERYIPGDRQLAELWVSITRAVSIDSVPPEAEVYYRPFGAATQPWRLAGRTPIRGLRIPQLVHHEWKIEKAGFTPIEDVGVLGSYITVRARAPEMDQTYVLEPVGTQPPGMVRVSPRGPQLLATAGLEHLPPFKIEDFWIDRYEVTNAAYKRFVDAGGYHDQRFWTQPFVKDGRLLTWEAARTEFKDATGRPGPATWELGTYPEGKDNEPVGGVSWYEAAAYAKFAGKSLPTIFHWSVVADRRATSGMILPLGRYMATGPVPVGQAGARSRYGTHDLAGNVKEWCWNEAGGGRRYTLGGGFDDPAYFFNDPDGRSPWDRGPSFGFRCMKLPAGQVPQPTLTAAVPFFFRDFSRERPVSDAVWRAYASLYEYDHSDLSPVLQSTDDSARDWRHEIATIRAAYGNEHMSVHVLVPKRASPPFQTLVYYPGINALHQRSSREGIGRMLEIGDYVIRSGRALVYPIYKATHERQTALTSDFPTTTTLFRDHVIMWSKDLQRTIDYLESRPDIDRNKIGYLGRSWGAAMGTIMVATEPRLKLAIFKVGGFYFQHARPEVEAINFAPRVKVPSLMLNGRYDFFFPVDTSQRYMFNLIGVSDAQKRWVVYDTSHNLPREKMVEETLRWLDRFFGAVTTR